MAPPTDVADDTGEGGEEAAAPAAPASGQSLEELTKAAASAEVYFPHPPPPPPACPGAGPNLRILAWKQEFFMRSRTGKEQQNHEQPACLWLQACMSMVTRGSVGMWSSLLGKTPDIFQNFAFGQDLGRHTCAFEIRIHMSGIARISQCHRWAPSKQFLHAGQDMCIFPLIIKEPFKSIRTIILGDTK